MKEDMTAFAQVGLQPETTYMFSIYAYSSKGLDIRTNLILATTQKIGKYLFKQLFLIKLYKHYFKNFI